jgi:hypothetical protein
VWQADGRCQTCAGRAPAVTAHDAFLRILTSLSCASPSCERRAELASLLQCHLAPSRCRLLPSCLRAAAASRQFFLWLRGAIPWISLTQLSCGAAAVFAAIPAAFACSSFPHQHSGGKVGC